MFTVKNFYKPSINLSEKECLELYEQMKILNSESEKLNYSIFHPDITKKDILDFFSKILLCIVENSKGEIVLFNYKFILSEKDKLVHLGLVLSNNKKNNKYIIYYFGLLGSVLLHQQLGNFKAITITTTPKVIEYVYEHLSDVEPSLKRSDKNKKNIKYIDIMKNEYIEPIVTNGRKVSIDYRNYLIKLNEKEEIGFVDDYYSQSKAHKMKYNYFALSSVDYKNGKDLIIIGNYNWFNRIRDFFILSYLRMFI